MNARPEVSPGTVSKILWHFTGGPTWNAESRRQNSSPKPAADAYKNLTSILRTRQLRLGTYKEVIKVIIPKTRKYDHRKRKFETERNVPVEITSSPICCVSDIPAPHLRYHAYRYGKFAIGFHRSGVLEHGFNPVLYTLEDTPVVRSIYRGFSSLNLAEPDEVMDAVRRIEDTTEDEGLELAEYIRDELRDIQSETNSLVQYIDSAKYSLENLVAFVKTFSRDEFSTIYCEREWRSTQGYKFAIDDVAMIVVPRRVSRTTYFEQFVQRVAPRLRLPRRIPIVPWEDLVEH